MLGDKLRVLKVSFNHGPPATPVCLLHLPPEEHLGRLARSTKVKAPGLGLSHLPTVRWLRAGPLTTDLYVPFP